MKTQKIFFGIKQSIIVIMWGFFSSLRRLLAIIGFLTPSLGLFSILNHWLAEQYLFTMRTQHHPLPIDQIQLFNMSEQIRWKEYDRATYEFPADPAPPSYALYTGLTLKYCVAVFFLLQVFNTLSVALVKHFTSEQFRQPGHRFKKVLHCLHCLNIPVPYSDWDQGLGSLEEFRRRYSNTETEMAGCFGVNCVFGVVSLLPIWFTGKTNIQEICYSYLEYCFISDIKIKMRHNYLAATFGTKPEEDRSYENSHKLMITTTVCMISFLALEIAFYFLYNRKVRVPSVI